MSELADLRLHVHTVYSVKEDGTEDEMLEQTIRYTDAEKHMAFSSAEQALSSVGVKLKKAEGEVDEDAPKE